ncbi:MAG: tetratricopeptide repeat protein [Arenimonas sp.]|uniref:tetratricopeptide repeat protein n=1 Tax=Arenimonas sp. TaxID=1872635 RepID=UPI0025B82CCA|nr:tetratricopeptide repeat protein [Arenimonas sp.]MBW8366267.1 tetratricopeptide repeat protein [Arenimonas sp.]
MTIFVLASLALVALALAFVLPPLWRDARGTAVVLALGLPLTALGLYALLGLPAALDPVNTKVPESLDDAIVQLERRLAEEPASVEGWVLLARSRSAQERWPEARDALAKAYALLPDEPDLMVEYADAQMRAAPDGRFPESAVALLEQVVAGQPSHQRGLFYLGAARLQADRPADAAQLWEQLLPLVDAQTAQALSQQIALAREQAGLPELQPPPASAAAPSLELTIDIAPALASQLAPGDTLFVFARTVDGAGIPVAVKRLPATGFPISLRLSDADGLMPAQKLFAQAKVRLMARVSKSGDAAAVAGDLEAEVQLVDVADGAAFTLVIDRVHP